VNLGEYKTKESPYARFVFMAEAKAGKTSWIVSSTLGALPHQKQGVVDRPENLHLIGFDEAFAEGLADFITGICKRPDSMLNINVHPLSDARKKSGSKEPWDFEFYNTTRTTVSKVVAACNGPGTHAIIISSLSGLCEGLITGLAGPPNSERKGGGMDLSKWQDLSRQVVAIRNALQDAEAHVFWEAHVEMNKKYENNKEVAFEQVNAGSGKTSRSFEANVGMILRLRRETTKHEGTKCDRCFIDTKPAMGYFSAGRKVHSLDERETDLVTMLQKLGKEVAAPAAVVAK
jgi:hypothetical protein